MRVHKNPGAALEQPNAPPAADPGRSLTFGAYGVGISTRFPHPRRYEGGPVLPKIPGVLARSCHELLEDLMTPPVSIRITRSFFSLLLGLGLTMGCSSGESAGPGNKGTGGARAGTGGSGSPGTGGSNNPGSGGSNSPGTGGSGNPGSGGSNTPGSGGSGNPGSGGSGNPGSGGSGNPGSGGSGMGGNIATGGNSGGNAPAGYWTYPSKMWAGCSWTGIDSVANTTTTIMPRDFLTKPANEPYCVKGTVHASYEAVSLLGFNLAEPITPTLSCAAKPANANAEGPPAVTLTGSGIAVSFSKTVASELRIQVQGPNGGKSGAAGEADRWCYKITEVSGSIFAPFNKFNSKCWDGTGTTFDPTKNKISAVVFLVPGTAGPTPYDYCIGGFNTGTSAADAPPYMGSTDLSGTLGGKSNDPTLDRDLDFARVKVKAGGKSYIIQNNNWGNPEGTSQTLMYKNNSFTITGETGGSPGGGVPASFPSIYIGANGQTAMGTFSTTSDDGLPKQISAIGSVKSTFRYNRANGDYNATYDIWFSSAIPRSEYKDAISGFVMVWLYKPSNHQPIGSVMRRGVTIPGAPGTYDVWVGPRGGSMANANAPVVSYVATSTIMGFTDVDLKPFMTDAAMHGIQSSWYLTDVFGGFEIWSGSGTNGLAVQEFTAVVQ